MDKGEYVGSFLYHMMSMFTENCRNDLKLNPTWTITEGFIIFPRDLFKDPTSRYIQAPFTSEQKSFLQVFLVEYRASRTSHQAYASRKVLKPFLVRLLLFH